MGEGMGVTAQGVLLKVLERGRGDDDTHCECAELYTLK